MRPRRHVTALLLVTALAPGGCCKADGPVEAKAGPADRVAAPVAGPVAKPNEGSKSSLDRVPAAIVATMETSASYGDGEAAYRAGHYEEAATIFGRYAEQRPANAWGHYMLGLSAWKSGDLVKSEGAFEEALRVDPRHVKSLINLSRVFIDQKRPADALDRLTRAAEIAPDSIEVHRLLGRTYHTQGKLVEAETAYRHAVELNELDAWSMNNLGLVLIETQRAAEALPLLTKAVELRKDVALFHNNLGMALEHAGRFRDAATAYAGAVAVDPGYRKAKQNLTRIEAMNAKSPDDGTRK